MTSALVRQPLEGPLRDWMSAAGFAGDEVTLLDAISGGTQNDLIPFRYGEGTYLLRLPSPTADGAALISRETRILTILRDTDVPHPRLVGFSVDSAALGIPFHVTDFVDGYNVMEALPTDVAGDESSQRQVAVAVADAAAALAGISAAGLGGDSPDRRVGWADRQTSRWSQVFDDYAAKRGYPADALPSLPEVRRQLEAQSPDAGSLGVLHGDMHLGNILISNDSSKVAALVDWELNTIGDRRLDLAHLVVSWPGRLETIPAPPGWVFNDTRPIIDRYIERSGQSLDHFNWFLTLASYRLAAILEGTFSRALRGQADEETGRRLHDVANELLERAADRSIPV